MTFLTLMFGVVFGMKIIPFIFNLLQENDTPCAWFPALEHTIPFSFCFSDNDNILLKEPLILKDLVICKSSLLT